MRFNCKIIREKLKGVSAEAREGVLILKVPLRMSDREVDEILKKHHRRLSAMIDGSREREEKLSKLPPITRKELDELTEKARMFFSERAAFYAEKLGVKYGRITIRSQTSRWGSCSTKGNLNFNCLLMLAPEEVADSVAAHEVTHLVHHDHSNAFYETLLNICPDYHSSNDWLKKNGDLLIGRMKRGKDI